MIHMAAQLAHKEGLTLKESAVKLDYVSAEDFEKWVLPSSMCGTL